MSKRFTRDGRLREALGCVELVTDPAHRFIVLSGFVSEHPEPETYREWLFRPGGRTRGQWFCELAALAPGLALSAPELIESYDQCLRWWP